MARSGCRGPVLDAPPHARQPSREEVEQEIASGRGSDERYYVYVIQLDDAVGKRDNPRYPPVYVGQSARPPRERFEQHKSGHRASRVVRKHGKWLRWRLFDRYNPLPSRQAAEDAERELASRLRAKGYTVYGGH
jgi:GIY-YIG catalytic domain